MSELSTNGPDMAPEIPQSAGAVSQYLEILNGPYYAECLSEGPPRVWSISVNPPGSPPDLDMVYMQIALPVAVAEDVIRNRKVLELTDEEWEAKRAALQARVDSGDLPPRELAHANHRGLLPGEWMSTQLTPSIKSTTVFGNPGCLHADVASLAIGMARESRESKNHD